MEKRMNYIKGALVIMLRNLEEGSRDQRSKQQILVSIEENPTVRSARQRFKLKSKDELRVDLSHLAYYILLWIAYVDDTYNIYRAPKDRNRKYLLRIYWALEEKRFRDTKYIHGWHLVEV